MREKKKETEAFWREQMEAVQRDDSPERTPKTKKKAAVGQSPSPSKQKTAAPAALTRAPISQLTKKTTPAVFQEPLPSPAPQLAGSVLVVQGSPPVVVSQAEPAPVAEEQPPIAAQQAGPSFLHSAPTAGFQTFQEADPGLAKKQEERLVAERAEAMRKRTKAEKGEQFQRAVYEGAFETQVGREGLIRSFQSVLKRHRGRERVRCEIVLGEREYSDKFESKHFNQHVADIKESCKDDDPATFRHLIENYKDEDYFCLDTDERVTQLVAFAYVGTTAMHQTLPSGSGSGLSESGREAPPPFVDLTGRPLERAKKPPDLDKTITETGEAAMDASEMETSETPQPEETPVSETSTGSKKKKSKQRRKAKWEGAAEPSTSTPRLPGPKEAVLQEALEVIEKEQDDAEVRAKLG